MAEQVIWHSTELNDVCNTYNGQNKVQSLNVTSHYAGSRKHRYKKCNACTVMKLLHNYTIFAGLFERNLEDLTIINILHVTLTL